MSKKGRSIYDQYEEPKAPEASEPSPPASAKPDRFCRMRRVEVVNSHWPAYQAEVVYIQGDKIVRRELLGKPDMFEYVYAQIADQLDPRNEY